MSLRNQSPPDGDLGLPVRIGSSLAEKYRLERILGRGGMGIVVAARHERLGETVAIKLLLPNLACEPAIVARFLQEGRAAVKIRSEHVARVLDVGTLADGAPFLVMEYLDGKDLQKVLLERRQLPVDEAVDLVLQACEAIAEAHSLGIIHRDLKPSNLILTLRADGSPCVKVIDFGISKIQCSNGEGGAAGERTSSSIMLGSPTYMAPEQMRSTRDVDARSDIWSLGCILYALATGAPPFTGETHLAVYEKILQGLPDWSKKRPDAPPGLDSVVRRALMANPAERFADVGAFATALSPFASSRGKISVERVRGLAERSGAKLPSLVIDVEAGPSAAEGASADPTREETQLEPEPTVGWASAAVRAEPTWRRPIAIGAVIFVILAAIAFLSLAPSWAPSRTSSPAPTAASPAEPESVSAPADARPRAGAPGGPGQAGAAQQSGEELAPPEGTNVPEEARRASNAPAASTRPAPAGPKALSPQRVPKPARPAPAGDLFAEPQ